MELVEYLKKLTNLNFEINDDGDIVYAGRLFIIIHHFRTKSKVTVYDKDNYESKTCEMNQEKILTTMTNLIGKIQNTWKD
jgi:hypothetical protein